MSCTIRATATVAALTVAMCLAATTVVMGDDRVPDGVSSSDWSGIRAAYEAKRHEVFAVDGGYQARNPGQRWLTRFDGRGFETTPDSGQWSWGLELVSMDMVPATDVAPANSRCASMAPTVSACNQRIEYQWNDAVTEWFINDRRGLEHGFTIQKRQNVETPKSQNIETAESQKAKTPKSRNGETSKSRNVKTPKRKNEPLRLTLGVRGNLRPRIGGSGGNVAFVDAGGAAVVNYNGLTAFDATGKTLPAWFEADDRKSSLVIGHSLFLRIVVDDAEAIYPITIDPIAQQAYLKASNTDGGDLFGWSVAASGDTVVVGAIFEESNATGVNGDQANNSLSSGAVYVFVRDVWGTWAQQAYLKPSNTGGGENFGRSVAASGDTIVVGAIGDDSNATGVNGNQADDSAVGSGAAYVFIRDAMGNWSQQAYLKASNTEAEDNFGISVGLSGETIVVGAWQEDSSATGVNGNDSDNNSSLSGAAYIFVRDGTTWSQQAYLKASNTGGGDRFGQSVAVSGDTVVIGAYRESSSATGVNGNENLNNAIGSGAAYVFRRTNTTWTQEAYLKASNTGSSDEFGYSVAISGDTAVIGARNEASSATGVNGNQGDSFAFQSGAAYVFVRNGTTWSQQAYVKASNTEAGDMFGFSVGVLGDTMVAGAFQEDSNATGVDGNQANNGAGFAGAAYLFSRDTNGVWSQAAYLKASNTGTSDQFGHAVAVSDDTVLVTAWAEDSIATGVNGDQDDNSAGFSGAAYVFTICPLFTGDMNCDCTVDPSDVEPFVQALLDPAGYAASHPGCDIFNADLQPDGNVDAGDAQQFINLLVP